MISSSAVANRWAFSLPSSTAALRRRWCDLRLAGGVATGAKASISSSTGPSRRDGANAARGTSPRRSDATPWLATAVVAAHICRRSVHAADAGPTAAAADAIDANDVEILVQHITVEDADGGAPSDDSDVVEKVDAFARAKVINWMKRVGIGGAAAAMAAPHVQEVEGGGSPAMFRASMALASTLPEATYGPRVAVGYGPTEKAAEDVCFMHAARIVDALGLPLFAISSAQSKHAEAVRAAGRWAPLPGDGPRAPDTPSPPALRLQAADGGETAGGSAGPSTQGWEGFAPVSPPPASFTPLTLSLLDPTVLDVSSVRRVRKFFLSQNRSLEKCTKIVKRPSTSGARATFTFVATIALYRCLDSRFGRRTAVGVASDSKSAFALACMHAELIVDALGAALYPDDELKQAAHAVECRSLQRRVGSLEAHAPSPPPLRLNLHSPVANVAVPDNNNNHNGAAMTAAAGPPLRSGGDRDGAVALVAQDVDAHICNVRTVAQLEPACLRVVEELCRLWSRVAAGNNDDGARSSATGGGEARHGEANDGWSDEVHRAVRVELVGVSTYRAAVFLTPPDGAPFLGIGIADSPEDAEVLCCMHATAIAASRNLLRGLPPSLAERVEASGARGGWWCPSHSSNVERSGDREGSAAGGKKLDGLPPALKGVASEHKLGRMHLSFTHAEFTSTWKAQSLEADKRNGGDVRGAPSADAAQTEASSEWTAEAVSKAREHTPRDRWDLAPDSNDGFMLVHPAQTSDDAATMEHTLISPRVIDVNAYKRFIDFMERHGRSRDSVFRTTRHFGVDMAPVLRAEARLPLPPAFGDVRALGEAQSEREAELLACMHAELIVDALGLPFYDHKDLQNRHALAARKLGRFAPFHRKCAWTDDDVRDHVNHNSQGGAATLAGYSARRPPPPLRKEKADSIRWLRHVQRHHSATQVVSDPDAAAVEQLRVIPASHIEPIATQRMSHYCRRMAKNLKNETQVIKVPQRGAAQNMMQWRAKLDVPLPPGFGARTAMGVSNKRATALVLCMMHATEIVDALGIALCSDAAMQKEHVEMVVRRGRPRPPASLQSFGTATPLGYRCDEGANLSFARAEGDEAARLSDATQAANDGGHYDDDEDAPINPVHVVAAPRRLGGVDGDSNISDARVNTSREVVDSEAKEAAEWAARVAVARSRSLQREEEALLTDLGGRRVPRTGDAIVDTLRGWAHDIPLDARAREKLLAWLGQMAASPATAHLANPPLAHNDAWRWRTAGAPNQKSYVVRLAALPTPFHAVGVGGNPLEAQQRAAMAYFGLVQQLLPTGGARRLTYELLPAAGAMRSVVADDRSAATEAASVACVLYYAHTIGARCSLRVSSRGPTAWQASVVMRFVDGTAWTARSERATPREAVSLAFSDLSKHARDRNEYLAWRRAWASTTVIRDNPLAVSVIRVSDALIAEIVDRGAENRSVESSTIAAQQPPAAPSAVGGTAKAPPTSRGTAPVALRLEAREALQQMARTADWIERGQASTGGAGGKGVEKSLISGAAGSADHRHLSDETGDPPIASILRDWVADARRGVTSSPTVKSYTGPRGSGRSTLLPAMLASLLSSGPTNDPLDEASAPAVVVVVQSLPSARRAACDAINSMIGPGLGLTAAAVGPHGADPGPPPHSPEAAGPTSLLDALRRSAKSSATLRVVFVSPHDLAAFLLDQRSASDPPSINSRPNDGGGAPLRGTGASIMDRVGAVIFDDSTIRCPHIDASTAHSIPDGTAAPFVGWVQQELYRRRTRRVTVVVAVVSANEAADRPPVVAFETAHQPAKYLVDIARAALRQHLGALASRTPMRRSALIVFPAYSPAATLAAFVGEWKRTASVAAGPVAGPFVLTAESDWTATRFFAGRPAASTETAAVCTTADVLPSLPLSPATLACVLDGNGSVARWQAIGASVICDYVQQRFANGALVDPVALASSINGDVHDAAAAHGSDDAKAVSARAQHQPIVAVNRRNAARYYCFDLAAGRPTRRLAALLALQFESIECIDVASIMLNGAVFGCCDAAATFAAVLVYRRTMKFNSGDAAAAPRSSASTPPDTVAAAPDDGLISDDSTTVEWFRQFRSFTDSHCAAALLGGAARPAQGPSSAWATVAAIKGAFVEAAVRAGVYERSWLRYLDSVQPDEPDGSRSDAPDGSHRGFRIPFVVGPRSAFSNSGAVIELCLATALPTHCRAPTVMNRPTGANENAPPRQLDAPRHVGGDATPHCRLDFTFDNGKNNGVPLSGMTALLCSNRQLSSWLADCSLLRLDGPEYTRCGIVTPPVAGAAIADVHETLTEAVGQLTPLTHSFLSMVERVVAGCGVGRVELDAVARGEGEWDVGSVQPTAGVDGGELGLRRGLPPVRFPPSDRR